MNAYLSDSPPPRRIKEWDIADRPREKFLTKGRAALSDAELLAILLGQGYRDFTAMDLARKILQHCNNNLHELGKLTPSELAQIKGVGPAKAVSIAAALELGRRRKELHLTSTKPLQSSKDIFLAYQHLFEDLQHEEMHVLLLNRSSKPLACKCISIGGISATIVDVRKILKEVVQYQSVRIVLMHNHPSGNLVPSKPDKDFTAQITKACAYFDVEVLDHLIFGNHAYYSFADQQEPSLQHIKS